MLLQKTRGRRKNGAGEGNRTPVISLEGFCSTIELHPLNRLFREQTKIEMVGGEGFEPS